MHKDRSILLRWLLWCMLWFTACTSSEAQTVYITRTGAKFHEGSCRYLRQSKIAIDLQEAKERGYTACSVCNPDELADEEEDEVKAPQGSTPKPQDGTAIQKKTNVISAQCTAYTKAGSRCRRSATSNGRCWQHQ